MNHFYSSQSSYYELAKAYFLSGSNHRSATPSSSSDLKSTGLKRASPFSDSPIYGKKRKIKDKARGTRGQESKVESRRETIESATSSARLPKLKPGTGSVARQSDTQNERRQRPTRSANPSAVNNTSPHQQDVARNITSYGSSSPETKNSIVRGDDQGTRLEASYPSPDSTNCDPSPIASFNLGTKPAAEDSLARIASPNQLGIPTLRISSLTQVHDPSPTPKKARKTSRQAEFSRVVSPPKAKLKDRLMKSTTTVEGHTVRCDDEGSSEKVVSKDSQAPPDLYSVDDHPILDAATASKKVGSDGLEPLVAPMHNRSSKVTYTAPHRTVLQEDDEDAFLLDHEYFGNQTLLAGRKRTRRLPSLAPIASSLDVFDADDDADEIQTNSMRSLHELKEAGISQRLNKQTEALLDDLEQSMTKAEQRSALLELISKVQSPGFMRQFLDAGSEIRILSLLEPCSDDVMKFLLCSFMLLLIGNSSSSMTFLNATHTRALRFLESLLDCNQDIVTLLKDRTNNVSRDCQKETRKLCEFLRKSAMWTVRPPSKITMQSVALQCLDYLERNSRKSGSEEELLSKDAVEKLLDILSGVDGNRELSIQTVAPQAELALSVLESSALVYSTTDTDCTQLWTDQCIDRLMAFSSGIQTRSETQGYGQLLTLSLRLCLNLSNGDASTGAKFARPEFVNAILGTIKKHFGLLSIECLSGSDLVLDNLVLSLGLLINISEKAMDVEQLFLIAPKGKNTPLETLLSLFKSRVADAFEVSSVGDQFFYLRLEKPSL